MASNQQRWIKDFYGATEPLRFLGLFQAGSTQAIKRGELLEYTGDSNTAWVPMDSDHDMTTYGISVAAEEIKSGDLAGYYDVFLPRPGDVWEYDLATAGLRGWSWWYLMSRFSRDGSAIYLPAFNEDRVGGIWEIPLHGGEPSLVVESAEFMPPFLFSVGPDHLYVTVADHESDIWVMDAVRDKIQQNETVQDALLATCELPLTHYYVMWGRPIAAGGCTELLISTLTAARGQPRRQRSASGGEQAMAL